MNIEAYNLFLQLQEKGIKKQAMIALREFIDSFVSDDEKISWTKTYISEIRTNRSGLVRYELFEEIIFPSLLVGYKVKDVFSMYWLAIFNTNVIKNKLNFEKIDEKTSTQLLEECLELEPNNEEVRIELLNNWLEWISFSQHEWPIGILDGMNFATYEDCLWIKQKLKFIKALDIENLYQDFLQDYEDKLGIFIERRKKEL